MVKLSKIFPVLAIVAGLGSAFASRMPEVSKADDPVYEWTPEDPMQPGFTGTVAEAEQQYGCSGTQQLCATGELVSGTGPQTEQIFED